MIRRRRRRRRREEKIKNSITLYNIIWLITVWLFEFFFINSELILHFYLNYCLFESVDAAELVVVLVFVVLNHQFDESIDF